ncbi:hypothetical protein WDU94_007109 [Cyamophila willieti]
MKETSSNKSQWRTKCCRIRKSANCTTREGSKLLRRELQAEEEDSRPPWTCLRCSWEADLEVVGEDEKGKVEMWSISCPCPLEDLYRGTVKKLQLEKNVICDKCEGRGGKKGGNAESCPGCRGTGMTVSIQQIGPGMIQQIQTACGECRGQGSRINPKDRCKNCNGKKTVRDRKIIEVHIDKGMIDQQKIVLTGEGDQEPGLEHGDIIIVLEEKPHHVFKRNGNNLIIRPYEIALVEALCGFRRSIKTLDDRDIIISAAPGEVIKHSGIKMVAGEGMPTYKDPFERGNLIIQFSVTFPDSIPTDKIAAIEKCLPPRPVHAIPDGGEEVVLETMDPEKERAQNAYKQAWQEDEDQGASRVQCATS